MLKYKRVLKTNQYRIYDGDAEVGRMYLTKTLRRGEYTADTVFLWEIGGIFAKGGFITQPLPTARQALKEGLRRFTFAYSKRGT